MNADHVGDEPGRVWADTHLTRMRLELPSEKYKDSFFPAMAEFEAERIRQIPENMTGEQFPAYVQKLLDQAEGKNLPEGHIPSKEFWIIDAEGYAGRIILGLTFTPDTYTVGHHVGYAVRPSKRRRGYATKALEYLLDEARALKVYKLMPVCGFENIASRRVIERNGGVLVGPTANEDGLRFLIDLDASSAEYGGRYRT